MAKQTPNNLKEEVAELRALIRKAGLRSTSARLAVLQHLRQINSPMTHAELAEELVPLGLDKATIFRNLADLTEADLVTRTELGDHVWRFEIRDPDDPHQGKHPHFVCVDCGKVTCFADITFGKATQKRTEEIGHVTEILLKGHCHDCNKT